MRIASEGWPVLIIMALVLVAASALAWWLTPLAGWVLSAASVLLWLWGVWFFRDPDRVTPDAPDAVISPADGKVIKVDRAPWPKEIREGEAGSPCQRVSIFLNLFNVHVNRVPASGRIVRTAYVPGKFFNASLDKASEFNERSAAVMTDTQGRSIVFVQIAGLVARRIVNHLKPDQAVRAGERFGLIRFGSRAEVYFPAGSTIDVKVGDFVVAGETVLGRMAASAAASGAAGGRP